MGMCYVCAGELMEMRGKLICSRCKTINETCCDGGQCVAEQDPNKSPNYQETDDECF